MQWSVFFGYTRRVNFTNYYRDITVSQFCNFLFTSEFDEKLKKQIILREYWPKNFSIPVKLTCNMIWWLEHLCKMDSSKEKQDLEFLGSVLIMICIEYIFVKRADLDLEYLISNHSTDFVLILSPLFQSPTRNPTTQQDRIHSETSLEKQKCCSGAKQTQIS